MDARPDVRMHAPVRARPDFLVFRLFSQVRGYMWCSKLVFKVEMR